MTPAGVILNRVSSPRHTQLLGDALRAIGITVVGAVPRVDNLALPSRHLGLVQAGEHPELDERIARMFLERRRIARFWTVFAPDRCWTPGRTWRP